MTTRHELAELLPACTIIHGWKVTRFAGRRFGWHAVTAAGAEVFLGRNPDEAKALAKNLGRLWGTC